MEQRVQGAVAFRTRQDMGQGLFLSLAGMVTLVALVFAFAPGLRAIIARAAHTGVLWDKLADDPRFYLYPMSALALIIYAWLRRTYERLIVGPDGLRYVSYFGGPLAVFERLHPGWHLSWAAISKVELQVQSAGLVRPMYWLMVDPGGANKRIAMPLTWEQVPEIPHSRIGWISSRDEKEMRQAILASPLVRALRQFGAQVTERPGNAKPSSRGYDIAQDRGLMAAVVVLLAGLVYWLGDTFIVWPYMALENVPVWPYVLMGALGLGLGLHLGRHAPRLERTLISILLAGSLCAASYPGMLRLNALTALPGQQVFQYTQVRPAYFKPLDPGLPWIYFQTQTYWSGLPNGGTHEFRVIKGALGFYEVDTGRVQDEIHAWWMAHPPKPS